MARIRLCYKSLNKNNRLSENRTKIFSVNRKNLLFLGFVTSGRDDSGIQSRHSVSGAIGFIRDNRDDFDPILNEVAKYNDASVTEILDGLDGEWIDIILEHMANEYMPSCFSDYDAVSEVNPDGLENGCAVYAYEVV